MSEMTSLERMTAFAKGEPIDRIPATLSFGETACSLHGVSVVDYSFDADVMAKTEAKTYEMFKSDGTNLSITLRGIAEAMGSELEYKPNAISMVINPAVKKLEDIDRLKVVDPNKDGRLPIVLEALVRLKSKVGKEVGVSAGMAGPVSVAVNVCGAENFLKWTRKAPDKIKQMLDKINESNKKYIDELAKREIFSTSISDPVTSTDLLSRSQFLEFSLPYYKDLVGHIINTLGKKPATHICGHSKGIWKDIVEAGVASFSIDNVEDLAEAKEIMGNDIMIVGNVPPVEVLQMGDRESIRNSVRECILKAYDSPKGYMVSSGCQVPLGMPKENVAYYYQACREFGKYPIDVEKLRG